MATFLITLLLIREYFRLLAKYIFYLLTIYCDICAIVVCRDDANISVSLSAIINLIITKQKINTNSQRMQIIIS